MTNARQKLAHWGEAFAADYLQQRGYTILERNARTPYGEIDLVAAILTPASSVTVFVEVKTRRSTTYGYPEESVTRRKRAHMLAAAQAYLQTHPQLAGDWRIDVMAIYSPDPKLPPTVNYFENAVAEE